MKTIKKLLFTIVLLVILLIGYFYLYFKNMMDKENVIITGVVYHQNSGNPLSDVNITIHNDRYEDNNGNKNYDEYLGHDIYQVKTNSEGFFLKKIPKSAFVWIIFNKDGYVDVKEQGKNSTLKMNYKVRLFPKK